MTSHFPPPGSLLEGAVIEIRRRYQRGQLASALSVGQYVVETFFGGDPARARARGTKAVSIRRLIRHPDLGMSRSRLWVCIGVYVQACEVPASILEGLSLSHRELLLGVDVADVEILAVRCRAESWSSAVMRTEVGRARHARRRRPARRLIAALETAVEEIDQWDGVTEADRVRSLLVRLHER